MEHFLKEISFCGVMLDNLLYETTDKKLELYEILQRGIDIGAVKPLVRTVFDANEVESAFRYMMWQVSVNVRWVSEKFLVYLCIIRQNFVSLTIRSFVRELLPWKLKRI